MPDADKAQWFEQLADDDLGFVKRFVLASGSLKEMASQYGVSYPTVRRRLDRVIAKITVLESQLHESPFEKVLRLLAADGRLDDATFRTLIKTYREEKNP